MRTPEELITDRSTFSIRLALSDGWSLVSKHLGYYILGGILAVVIAGSVGVIPIVGSIIDNVILSPCLMAGAIYITWRISKGIGWTDFGDMFKGFNFLRPIALSSLIQGVAILILTGLILFNNLRELFELFKLTQNADPFTKQEEIKTAFLQLIDSKFLVSILLLMVALLIISCIWAFKFHFIVIYKMEAWPAMEMSRKIAARNLLPLIGMFLLLGIMIIISALPCGIGLLFTLPLTIGATYSAFAQITHCDQPDEIKFDFTGDEKQQ